VYSHCSSVQNTNAQEKCSCTGQVSDISLRILKFGRQKTFIVLESNATCLETRSPKMVRMQMLTQGPDETFNCIDCY